METRRKKRGNLNRSYSNWINNRFSFAEIIRELTLKFEEKEILRKKMEFRDKIRRYFFLSIFVRIELHSRTWQIASENLFHLSKFLRQMIISLESRKSVSILTIIQFINGPLLFCYTVLQPSRAIYREMKINN